jgi:hypothetical protein
MMLHLPIGLKTSSTDKPSCCFCNSSYRGSGLRNYFSSSTMARLTISTRTAKPGSRPTATKSPCIACRVTHPSSIPWKEFGRPLENTQRTIASSTTSPNGMEHFERPFAGSSDVRASFQTMSPDFNHDDRQLMRTCFSRLACSLILRATDP